MPLHNGAGIYFTQPRSWLDQPEIIISGSRHIGDAQQTVGGIHATGPMRSIGVWIIRPRTGQVGCALQMCAWAPQPLYRHRSTGRRTDRQLAIHLCLDTEERFNVLIAEFIQRQDVTAGGGGTNHPIVILVEGRLIVTRAAISWRIRANADAIFVIQHQCAARRNDYCVGVNTGRC